MDGMPYNEESLQRLRELLIGHPISRIEPNSKQGGMFTLFAVPGHRKGGENEDTLEIPLFSSGLGWWIEGVQRHRNEFSEYVTAEDMLKALFSFCENAEDPDSLKVEPLEDVMRRSLGFRVLDREFWVGITGIKGSSWAKLLQTPEGRAKIAADPLRWDYSGPPSEEE